MFIIISGMPYVALGVLYYTYCSSSHKCSHLMYLVVFQRQMYPCFSVIHFKNSALGRVVELSPLLPDIFLDSLCLVSRLSVRRSMRAMRTAATCSESTARRCVNTWLTSSTSSSTCRRSTWWTAYWRTSPFYRYLQESATRNLTPWSDFMPGV